MLLVQADDVEQLGRRAGPAPGAPCGAGSATPAGPGRPSAGRAAAVAAARSGSEVMSVPSKRTLPASGSSSRSAQRASVVLPQPEGPVRARVSPGATDRPAPRSTGSPGAVGEVQALEREQRLAGRRRPRSERGGSAGGSGAGPSRPAACPARGRPAAPTCVDLVGHHQHRGAAGGGRGQAVEHRVAGVGVEPGGGLVGHQHARLQSDRARASAARWAWPPESSCG